MTEKNQLNASPPHSPVLILHNAPDPRADAGGHRASDAGVMDQVAAVTAALKRLGTPCRIATVRRLDDIPVALAAGPESVVFNLVESLRPSPDAMVWTPAVCQAMGRACTGSDSRALLVTQDKTLTKRILADANVPVPRAVSIHPGCAVPVADLPDFPVIVKPVATDASEGIDADAVVSEPGPALDAAVARVHSRFRQPALVEQFIDGREFNVALLQDETGLRVLPLAEIRFDDFPPDKPRIVDYDAKWNEASFACRHTPRQIPAALTEPDADALRQTALAAWHAACCLDFARVDMRMDHRGRIYVLEINVNPDLSPDAGFAAALTAADIPFHVFVERMILNAAQRLDRGATVSPGPAPDPTGIAFRYAVPTDRDRIRAILKTTNFFRPDELAIAEEVLDEALAKGPAAHYQSFVAQTANQPAAGWICFGPTPCARGTWDIYWLAVDPLEQGRGVGRALMRFAETRIREAGGRLCVIETSGRDSYASTRRFYERIGYRIAGRIPDFYAPDDDKLVMTRPT